MIFEVVQSYVSLLWLLSFGKKVSKKLQIVEIFCSFVWQKLNQRKKFRTISLMRNKVDICLAVSPTQNRKHKARSLFPKDFKYLTRLYYTLHLLLFVRAVTKDSFMHHPALYCGTPSFAFLITQGKKYGF